MKTILFVLLCSLFNFAIASDLDSIQGIYQGKTGLFKSCFVRIKTFTETPDTNQAGSNGGIKFEYSRENNFSDNPSGNRKYVELSGKAYMDFFVWGVPIIHKEIQEDVEMIFTKFNL